MMTVTITLYVAALEEAARDVLKSFGYVADGSSIWVKVSSDINVPTVLQELTNLCHKSELTPYHIEITSGYFSNKLDKYEPVDYNAITA